MSSTDTTETEAPQVEVDERREALLASLTEALGDGIVDSYIRPGDDLWIRTTNEVWAEAADVARNRLGFRYFGFLSAIDWRPSPFGRYEDAEVDSPLADKLNQPYEIEPGYTGGDTRFQVFARVSDITTHQSFTLKVDVDDDEPAIDTWSKVYWGANWHERETAEMFGIHFRGHPDLRKIYLPGDFEGHPLRKDYALLSRVVKPWPGIVDVEPMPAAASDEDDAEGGADA